MKESTVRSAEIVGLFCRQQMQVKKGIPVRSSEMGVLIYIEKQEEPVTPLLVSSFFRISKPSVTVMINSLVRQQYLQKAASPTDGRSYTVSLTAAGRELVESTAAEYFRSMEQLEEQMGSADFGRFIDLMQQATEILSGEAGRP
ncbi:MarR family transcriptional regulator [Paenibacillus sp. MMS20-IR301]|uniref:MarR family winged helix-turn-helix transcriptional regulator n=1 Tax=Paenibacillus sp. MMS20-IR301 TaxID=2895946 RepID=UPI0028E2EC45|nr:MarR family transcriptional regulator [Paenibacillus sp. MMS20-IR301]WNS43976.1 MarR family transcriptional regulator [Paenibacillus sp. MMS20-IR301]